MQVKICGLRSRTEAAAAAAAGASLVGMVFFPPSPRNVSFADARWIAEGTPEGLIRVALIVDPEDAFLEALLAEVPVDMLQLHGAESPERVADVRQRFGLPVMKAIGVAEPEDLEGLEDYEAVADRLLVDARAPADATRPGGRGVSFDWRLLAGRRWNRPWLLAGGLNPENVAEAIRISAAPGVDVSSGVEYAPGYKDRDRIAAFVRAACNAVAQDA